MGRILQDSILDKLYVLRQKLEGHFESMNVHVTACTEVKDAYIYGLVYNQMEIKVVDKDKPIMHIIEYHKSIKKILISGINS